VPSVLGPRGGVNVLPTEIVKLSTSDFPDPNGAAVYGVVLSVMTLSLLYLSRRATARHDYTTFAGRGAQPWRRPIGRWRWLTTGFCWFYVTLAVILPLLVIIVVSLQPYVSTDPVKTGLTISNYHALFSSPVLSRSIRNSVLLAVATALTTAVMSVLIGYVLVRTRIRGRGAVDYLTNSTLGIPETIFGLGVLWAWVSIPIGVYATDWILYIAYVAIFLPYAVQLTVSAFRQFDGSLEDAARVFGASRLVATRRILLPLLAPALLSGAVIVMYHAVRELSASILLYSSGTEVMSVTIYGLYVQGTYTELCALALVNVAVVLVLVAVANTIARRFQGTRVGAR
jgi:iron(III) transport system permease protein